MSKASFLQLTVEVTSLNPDPKSQRVEGEIVDACGMRIDWELQKHGASFYCPGCGAKIEVQIEASIIPTTTRTPREGGR